MCRPPKCGEHICWQAASQPWCCKSKQRAAVWPDQRCFPPLGHTYTGNDVRCSISAICTKLSFKSKTYLMPKDQNMCIPPVVCVFIFLCCAGVLPLDRATNPDSFISNEWILFQPFHLVFQTRALYVWWPWAKRFIAQISRQYKWRIMNKPVSFVLHFRGRNFCFGLNAHEYHKSPNNQSFY